MDHNDLNRWSKLAADWATEYHANIADKPVRAQTTPGEIAAKLPKRPHEAPGQTALRLPQQEGFLEFSVVKANRIAKIGKI